LQQHRQLSRMKSKQEKFVNIITKKSSLLSGGFF
jgi:hypothetical protein